jgi:hypothetical protein
LNGRVCGLQTQSGCDGEEKNPCPHQESKIPGGEPIARHETYNIKINLVLCIKHMGVNKHFQVRKLNAIRNVFII